MGEFEAYNSETKEWEVFPPSAYKKVKSNQKYTNIRIDESAL